MTATARLGLLLLLVLLGVAPTARAQNDLPPTTPTGPNQANIVLKGALVTMSTPEEGSSYIEQQSIETGFTDDRAGDVHLIFVHLPALDSRQIPGTLNVGFAIVDPPWDGSQFTSPLPPPTRGLPAERSGVPFVDIGMSFTPSGQRAKLRLEDVEGTATVRQWGAPPAYWQVTFDVTAHTRDGEMVRAVGTVQVATGADDVLLAVDEATNTWAMNPAFSYNLEPVAPGALTSVVPVQSPTDGTLATLTADGVRWAHDGLGRTAPLSDGVAPADVRALAWSDDGRWLAASYQTDAATGLMALNTATGQWATLGDPLVAPATSYGDIRWSPDTAELAVVQQQDGAARTHVFDTACLTNPATQCPSRVLPPGPDDGDTGLPVWYDDGTLLYLCGAQLCTLSRAGQLVTSPAPAPADAPRLYGPRVSRSGRWAVVDVPGEGNQQRDLHSNYTFPLLDGVTGPFGWVRTPVREVP